jgi:hypothetical protein
MVLPLLSSCCQPVLLSQTRGPVVLWAPCSKKPV